MSLRLVRLRMGHGLVQIYVRGNTYRHGNGLQHNTGSQMPVNSCHGKCPEDRSSFHKYASKTV